MYRVSPFTYMVSGMLSVGVANTNVVCAPNEYLHFQPVNGTCEEYIGPYKAVAGGYMQNPDATSDCRFCPMDDTNVFLKMVTANYDDAWRNFGLLWVYCVFNVFAALFLYWLVRVPKVKKEKGEKTEVGGTSDAAQQEDATQKETGGMQEKNRAGEAAAA
jgi:ABC-type multidrug transport system permease subunit